MKYKFKLPKEQKQEEEDEQKKALQKLIIISACPGNHVTEQGLCSGQMIWRVR